jgi:hypothetical protein
VRTAWSWCGHSPGLGVRAGTDQVVDDAVAHSHGTGMLRLAAGGWRLDALDEVDLTLLEPGSDDPCPAEVASAAGRDG